MSDKLLQIAIEKVRETRPSKDEFLHLVFRTCTYEIPATMAEQFSLSSPIESGTRLVQGDVAFSLTQKRVPHRSYLYVGNGRWITCDRLHGLTWRTTQQIRSSSVFRRITKDTRGNPVSISLMLGSSHGDQHMDAEYHYWFLAHGDGIQVNKLRKLADQLGVKHGASLTSSVTRRIPGIEQELKKLTR